MRFVHPLAVGLLVTKAALASTPFIDEAWQGFSAPEIMHSGFTHKVNELPLSGAMNYNPVAWSGHYWPTKEGLINNRWSSSEYGRLNYKSPNKQTLFRMSQQQLAALAPSEKFDILFGNYHYPLKTEAQGYVSPRAEDWEGLCHGWAPASLNYSEPQPVTMRSVDGLDIPFGSADIKALLSYAYAYDTTTVAPNVGLRCNFGRWTGGAKECDQDLNAGAFHIIMANKLGIMHEGFVADVDRFAEVWNQPVIAFRSQVLSGYMKPSRTASRAAMWEIKIGTQLWYVDESEPAWEPDYVTGKQKITKKDYVYRIEIDAAGFVVGGTWDSAERPDFIWTKGKLQQYPANLEGLEQLL